MTFFTEVLLYPSRNSEFFLLFFRHTCLCVSFYFYFFSVPCPVLSENLFFAYTYTPSLKCVSFNFSLRNNNNLSLQSRAPIYKNSCNWLYVKLVWQDTFNYVITDVASQRTLVYGKSQTRNSRWTYKVCTEIGRIRE